VVDRAKVGVPLVAEQWKLAAEQWKRLRQYVRR
jgi:hypothetical protein